MHDLAFEKHEREIFLKKLEALDSLKKDYQEHILLQEKELIHIASSFDTYYEAYVFAKSLCKTQQEFNEAMAYIRPIVLDKMEHANKNTKSATIIGQDDTYRIT